MLRASGSDAIRSVYQCASTRVLLAVQLIRFLLGTFTAYRTFDGSAGLMGWGFCLYAVAELVYMTYHLDWTVFCLPTTCVVAHGSPAPICFPDRWR